MRNFVEKNWPRVLGILAVLCSWRLMPQLYVTAALLKLPNTIITISAIFAGLSLTYKNMLIIVDDKPPIIRLKKRRGKYSQLLSYVEEAIYSSIVLAIYSAILLVIIENEIYHGGYKLAFSFWVGLIIWVIASFVRLSKIMTLILKFGEQVKNKG